MEINNTFSEQILLEGYLYKKLEKYEYLLTDILIKNNTVVDLDYQKRYKLLNSIFLQIKPLLKELNNCMTINLHTIFNLENNFLNVFKNNFKYKNDICCIEQVSNFKKKSFVENRYLDIEKKYIEKGNFTDVYNVFNYQTNNKEGILYVKGIKESRYIKTLFSNCDRVLLDCEYNNKFNKWGITHNKVN